MSWCVSPWAYPVWDSLHLLRLDRLISFSMLGKFSTIISSKIFSYPFFFSSSSGTPIIQMLVRLMLSQRSLKPSSVLLILFTLFCSSEVISTISSLSSLICSYASDILLLIPSRIFLISVIVWFVSAYLFFNSSTSLLTDSCIFLHFVSKALTTFTVTVRALSQGAACPLLYLGSCVSPFVPSCVWYSSAFMLFSY